MGFFTKEEYNTRKLTKDDALLAEKIQQLRREKDFTQEALSLKLGRNPSYIAYIETGRRGLSLPMVYKLARVLKIKLKDLFDF